MNCKQYRAEIGESDFAAGRPAARFESHAAACAECRDFGGELAALRGLVAGLARVDAPPDFEFRLRARMAAAETARTRPWSENLLPRAVWLAAAGCLALAAVLALQTRTSRTPGAREASLRPAAAHSVGKPAATASADTAPRETSVEKIGETQAPELTTSAAGLNENVVTRRRARAASVASVNALMASRRRPATAAVARPSGESVASSGEQTMKSELSTSSMIGSPIIVSSAIPLPVSADERPLQVLFKDMQGASRVVNVDPVAFGSNESAARPTKVTFTKATKKQQGVW